MTNPHLYRKTLESFDFSFQPSVDRQKLQELATGRFIEHGENVVFLGPPGTGKTHLAIGLGLKAVQQGSRTVFTAALPLMAALTKAYAENRLEERLKQYRLPKLLNIDEIGYIPIDRHGAHLLRRRPVRGVPMHKRRVDGRVAPRQGCRRIAHPPARGQAQTLVPHPVSSCTVGQHGGCSRHETGAKPVDEALVVADRGQPPARLHACDAN
jgi:hypothetical protein